MSNRGSMCYSGINSEVKTMRACSESLRSWCSSRGSVKSRPRDPSYLHNERGLGFREMENIQEFLSFFFIKSFGSANCVSWVFLDGCGHRLPSVHLPKHLQAYWLAGVHHVSI